MEKKQHERKCGYRRKVAKMWDAGGLVLAEVAQGQPPTHRGGHLLMACLLAITMCLPGASPQARVCSPASQHKHF